MIIYFLAGSLTGISIVAFFMGKELYRFYKKNVSQRNELERMKKLNKRIKSDLTTKQA